MRSLLLFVAFMVVGSSSFAEAPKTITSSNFLETAKSHGYTFKITEMRIVFKPKFVTPASSTVQLTFEKLTLNQEPITMTDDKASKTRGRRLLDQLNEVCKNLLADFDGVVPGSQLSASAYSLNRQNEIRFLTCDLTQPAAASISSEN